MSSWKENLKDNLFIVLLGSVAISFMLGYFISQQQEARKRDQWAEILFRQAKHWLTDRGRKTADSVEQGLDYARSAAEESADRGAEYSRRLNRFIGSGVIDFSAFSDFSRRFMDEIKTGAIPVGQSGQQVTYSAYAA